MITEDELRRALQADADRAADPDAVLARVHVGVRRRRARTRAATAAAAALTVTGIAVGVPALGRLSAPVAPTPVAQAPVEQAPVEQEPTAAAPELSALSFARTPQQARQAFADAGYGEADARELAAVWQWLDADAVTVVAGLRLLDGQDLPLRPGQTRADAAGPRQPLSEVLQAYGAAGYDEADATALAARWDEPVTTVMIFVGEVLLQEDPPAASGAPR
ncbi:hypothetical protein [Quadrisphaera sp. DSM 44207]|uniref:hypothetical protein n=1 Tax=Quadrisphaera sp. DSM 44207 TaxID=1881057 RepID=UPI000889FAC9|nr:hypothetical protein [Quadrisphaera sp. DSM 44207]SDQ70246.1 hypothetical protein SAMN05428996_2462 [Quadrisphaera sp. DSM 44207]